MGEVVGLELGFEALGGQGEGCAHYLGAVSLELEDRRCNKLRRC